MSRQLVHVAMSRIQTSVLWVTVWRALYLQNFGTVFCERCVYRLSAAPDKNIGPSSNFKDDSGLEMVVSRCGGCLKTQIGVKREEALIPRCDKRLIFCGSNV